MINEKTYKKREMDWSNGGNEKKKMYESAFEYMDGQWGRKLFQLLEKE